MDQPALDDIIGDMPARTVNNQRNDKPRWKREDSVISFSPSTNSQTKILDDKVRRDSQSSNGESSMDSTSGTEDKVQITKLKLYIKVGFGILIPLVIILFLQTIAVIHLMTVVDNLSNRYQNDKGVPLCMECEKLQFSLASENTILDKLVKKMEGGKQICCTETAEQTNIFMKRYFDVKLQEERASGGLCMGTSSGPTWRDAGTGPSTTLPQNGVRCTNSSNPSAHLIGKNKMADGDMGPSIVTNWGDNSDIAFRNSVSFNEKTGRLTVPKSGFYYVYSQIHFVQIFPRVSVLSSEHGSTYDKKPNTKSLTHTIMRVHPRYYPEPLLRRRQSQCWVTNKLYSDYSSYVGGIMNLRQGDEIFVEVSNKSMVSSQSKMNFFGLFFVAPSERL